MIKDIVSNPKAKEFLKNELEFGKVSGTYLFYGSDMDLVREFALSFAKGLSCEEVHADFCDNCSICRRIDNLSYGDLKVLESPSIQEVRDLIEMESTSSFEGKRKIFLINDIGKLKKHSANALLKLIEEPSKNSFFILMNKDLNILPTIKSRCTLVKIRNRLPLELEVDDYTYDFFKGSAKDILAYKEREVDLKSGFSYMDIGEAITSYMDSQDIEDKINMYKSIRDFIRNKDYIKEIDKIYFAEEIVGATNDRNMISEIISYTTHALKDREGLEKRLEKKQMLLAPINMKLFLIDFYINL